MVPTVKSWIVKVHVNVRLWERWGHGLPVVRSGYYDNDPIVSGS